MRLLAVRDRLQQVAKRWPIDSILAALQILAEYRGRLRGSPHGRLLVELALCRVARLEDLADLGDLVARLSGGGSAPQKKKPLAADRPRQKPGTPVSPARTESVAQAREHKPAIENGAAPGPKAESTPPIAEPQVEAPLPGVLSLESVQKTWNTLIDELSPPLKNHLEALRPTAIPEPGLLVVGVPLMYNWRADACESTDAKGQIESRLRSLLGRSVTVSFLRETPRSAREDGDQRGPSLPPVHPDVLAADPLVQDVLKLFEARAVRVEPEESPES